MKLLLLAALAGATAASGGTALGATNQSLSGSPCFFVRDVGDRTVGGPHTLYFKVKDVAHMHALAYYHVETSGRCLAGVDSPTEHAGFSVGIWTPAAGRAAQICSQKDLRISADGGPTCRVASFTRMTPTEVAALPRGIRP
ncbi:MAG TPA: hypothetical protein VHN39_04775 [Phenylobacterium sp.]|jgi:hypothetical protein|nr:hypothetical protein [Phenylobacterium sp.]